MNANERQFPLCEIILPSMCCRRSKQDWCTQSDQENKKRRGWNRTGKVHANVGELEVGCRGHMASGPVVSGPVVRLEAHLVLREDMSQQPGLGVLVELPDAGC